MHAQQVIEQTHNILLLNAQLLVTIYTIVKTQAGLISHTLYLLIHETISSQSHELHDYFGRQNCPNTSLISSSEKI